MVEAKVLGQSGLIKIRLKVPLCLAGNVFAKGFVWLKDVFSEHP
jgi:hypothetical protein